ncbi:putative disease resistance protein, partial [Mucuna pruriens]
MANGSFAVKKFEEYPIVRQLCLIFRSKCRKDELEELQELQLGAKSVHLSPFRSQGLSVNGYEVSESMTSILSHIMMALGQPHIIILGVYGSSDARKDNVVEKITRRVERDKLFDVVVMARVMNKPDLRRIQGELGDMLGLQLQEKTLQGRATRLCDRIKMEDKILIILNDLWAGINLARIGIPFGDDHKGCKILLVAQTQDILSNQMNTQIEIPVDKHNLVSQVKELSKCKNLRNVDCPSVKVHQKQAIISNCYEVSGLINTALEETMEALANPNINMIGVYGSSALRRNNLIEKMSRRVKRDYLFDVTVMASVTEKPDLKRIQGELGNMLGLQFGEETVVGNAKLLCDRIKKEQRTLVVLNDPCAGINLDRVGIPFGIHHKGCKIVLLSGCPELLFNQMNTAMDCFS